MASTNYECCILGAGPAGLGTAVELTKNGIKDVLILDKNHIIGGLSRTEKRDSARFDVGPHRFFSKSDEVNALWKETLGNDFIPVDRLTRIYYKNKYFNYPIKAFDALSKLGVIESLHALFSYAATKFTKKKEAKTFEEWISQKFGYKLFDTFFKTYTEKVWGIHCNQIGAEWAAQRIKGLDIIEVIKNSVSFGKKQQVKTLVEQFDYPLLGAGQMYEAMADRAMKSGASLILNVKVTKIHCEDNIIKSIEYSDSQGNSHNVTANMFFSSIPLTHFFKLTTPTPSADILKAVEALYYRDHITVDVLVDREDIFPDQWIYIHSPEVKMARIANYNNFSKAMVDYRKKTALSIEYFLFQHDDIWKMNDDDVIALAKDELKHMKLVDPKTVDNAWVVRETESYPTYYLGYKEHYEKLKSEINKYTNLYPIGRGGMYKYNNQDHSIMSGLLAARNYLKKPGTPYDLWEINIDAEYHEGAKRG